jgi:hypothetical protein
VEEGEEDAGNPIGSKKALAQTSVTTANPLMAPAGPVRVAPPGMSGSEPFPQATEEEGEGDAGNPAHRQQKSTRANGRHCPGYGSADGSDATHAARPRGKHGRAADPDMGFGFD